MITHWSQWPDRPLEEDSYLFDEPEDFDQQEYNKDEEEFFEWETS